MAELFDIVDGKVVLNADELSIPVFKKIYDSDKSKDKIDSFNKISYIVFMYKWNSPYQSYLNEEVRDKIVKGDIFDKEDYELDEITKLAIERYKDFNHTFSLQFLEENVEGARKLMDFYKRVDWDAVDKAGRPIYSSRDLAANLEKAGGILKSFHLLREQVRKEELEPNKVRGGNQIELYEDPHSFKKFQQV
jgi:hypothetical protein